MYHNSFHRTTVNMHTMNTLVIFATALFCVQAVQLPLILSGSPASSEEEISVLVPQPTLPGVGVITQPVVQAVKVKVPRSASPQLKQLFITEALAARGLSLPVAATPATIVRGVRQAAGATATPKVVSDAPISTVTEVASKASVPAVGPVASKAN